MEWGSFRGRGLGEDLAGRWRGLAVKVMLNSSSSNNNNNNNNRDKDKDKDNKEKESLHNRLRD